MNPAKLRRFLLNAQAWNLPVCIESQGLELTGPVGDVGESGAVVGGKWVALHAIEWVGLSLNQTEGGE